MKMKHCRTIYPCRIVRPLGRFKVSNNDHFAKLLEEVEDFIIEKVIGDNPKRSILRCSKSHNSYYPCEYCFAKGIRVLTTFSQKKMQEMDERIKSQTTEIQNQIRFLESQPQSDMRDENIAVLKKVETEIVSKNMKKKTHQIVWPHSTSNGKLRTKKDTLVIVNRLGNGEILSPDQSKGITGRSHLINLETFDYVKDLPAEYMHVACLGVIKRLVELTFQVGEVRSRVTKRKLTSPSVFNELIADIKVTKECSRRIRDLDFSVYKAQEFRNLGIYFFPVIIQCLESTDKEIQLWLYLGYMLRASILPNTEYDSNIHEPNIAMSMDKFYSLYERLFGVVNCTYSIHVVCSHLLAMRDENPLTSSSAFSFENFYGQLRRCFVPGTSSTLKQIFKKSMMKNILSKHTCESPITITTHESALECNNMIYTFKDKKYCIYKVVDINNELSKLTCKRQGKYPAKFPTSPMMNWEEVGVFEKGGIMDEVVTVDMSEVSGKVLKVKQYLVTCPNNVLREK